MKYFICPNCGAGSTVLPPPKANVGEYAYMFCTTCWLHGRNPDYVSEVLEVLGKKYEPPK